MNDLEDLFRFVQLLHLFQSVERRVRVPKTERKENDVEHSFQLALVAWYLIVREKLALDCSRVIQYALVHDLAEVYAGDTWAFDTQGRESKREREATAQEQILNEFPHTSDIVEIIRSYDRQEDEEAQFVFALDKLLPTINIYLDNGHSWKEQGARLEQIVAYKSEKIARSAVVKKHFDILVTLLQEREPDFFNSPTNTNTSA